MSENNSDSNAIKERLMSLYESASPQSFTQLLVDYDTVSQEIDTESTRIHDLRAAARVQILFADGFKPAAAIRFLQEAISHIEAYGLPAADGPTLYPDQSASSQRPADSPSPGIEHARAERHQVAAAEALPSPAPLHVPPAPPVLTPARPVNVPRETRQPIAIKAAREGLMGRIPALLSTLYGPQRLTALNLSLSIVPPRNISEPAMSAARP